MELVTFAQYTLDDMLWTIAHSEEREADNLMWSLQTCFSIDARAQFHAAYLRYRDILIPQAKREYEELHDQFMTMFGVKGEKGALS